MTSKDIYSIPKSNLDEIKDVEPFDLNFIAFKGRLNRFHYFTFHFIASSTLVLFIYNGAIFSSLFGASNSIKITLVVITLITYFTITFSFYIRRLHDIGLNGLWSISTLIPYIGALISVVLIFIPSIDKDNQYGKRTLSNSKKIKKLFWWSLIGFIFLFIFSNFAISMIVNNIATK
jgi:uncharacterized membrane protein YhaH (DUF805 family)